MGRWGTWSSESGEIELSEFDLLKVGVVHFRPMTSSSHAVASAKPFEKRDRNQTKTISSPAITRDGWITPSSLRVVSYLQELGPNRGIKTCFEEEIHNLQTPGPKMVGLCVTHALGCSSRGL